MDFSRYLVLFLIIALTANSYAEGIVGENDQLPTCENYCKSWSPNNEVYDNSLLFKNFGHWGIGRCRGHAILTQKLTQLIVFKEGPRCEDITCEQNLIDSLKDAIWDYKVIEIQGYKNLMELSDESPFEQFMKAVVRGTSNRFNSRRSGPAVKNFESSGQNIFYDIIRRLALNSYPYLGVTGSQKISIHALLAYDHVVIEKQDRICIEDSNIVPSIEEGQKCENYLYFSDSEQAIYYHQGDWDEKLTDVLLFLDDDERDAKYKDAWKSYCEVELRGNLCQ